MKATATKSSPLGVQWVRREGSSPLPQSSGAAHGSVRGTRGRRDLLLLVGQNPFAVYAAMFKGAFGTGNNLAETLVKTTPLILTGLGVAVAFRMQLWNIGAEGQLYFGAIFANGWRCTSRPNAPGSLMIPLLVQRAWLAVAVGHHPGRAACLLRGQ